MIEILRNEGWQLNPNDRIVNAIIKRIEKNEGKCPCYSNAKDKRCPCSDYRENENCHCGLYIKI